MNTHEGNADCHCSQRMADRLRRRLGLLLRGLRFGRVVIQLLLVGVLGSSCLSDNRNGAGRQQPADSLAVPLPFNMDSLSASVRFDNANDSLANVPTEEKTNPLPAMVSSVSRFYEEGYSRGYDDGEEDAEMDNEWGSQYNSGSRYSGSERKEYQSGYEDGYEDGYNDAED